MNTHKTTGGPRKQLTGKARLGCTSCQCQRQFEEGEINMGGKGEGGFLEELRWELPLLAVKPTQKLPFMEKLLCFRHSDLHAAKQPTCLTASQGKRH